MEPFELYIFDLDGTLVNSLKDLTHSVNEVLAKFELSPRTSDEVASYLGKGASWLLSSAIEDSGGDAQKILPKARKYFLDIYAHNITKRSYLYPDVIDTLEELSRRGATLAICTNKPVKLAQQMLDVFDLTKFFAMILGGDSLSRKKPHPDPLLHILEQLSIDSKRTLMIGDSTFDINAGKGAGCYTCAVSYGYHPIETLKALKPDFVIDHFAQLSQLHLKEHN